MQETWVPSLGHEDPLEKEIATHSGILAWEIPWTEDPGRLQSIGSQGVRHACGQHPGPGERQLCAALRPLLALFCGFLSVLITTEPSLPLGEIAHSRW